MLDTAVRGPSRCGGPVVDEEDHSQDFLERSKLEHILMESE